MKKTLIVFLSGLSLLFAACGLTGGNSNEITVKYNGQEKTFEPRSTVVKTINGSSSHVENGQTVAVKFSSTSFQLNNFEEFSPALKSPEQIRVVFNINGDKGTDENTPIKTGEYIAPEGGKFSHNNVAAPYIFYFADGEQQSAALAGKGKLSGKVTINSVTDENIAGSLDLTDGENSIKGNFIANRKK